MLLADAGDFLRLLLRESAIVRHLRAAEKLVTIINSEDERVHRPRSQLLLDKLDELIYAIAGWRGDAESAYRQRSIGGLFFRPPDQKGDRQESDPALCEILVCGDCSKLYK